MAFSSCAFVTGAGSGIGEAAARRLASDGFAVAVVDVRQDAAARVAEEILSVGGRAISVVADVRDEASVAKGIAQTVEAFGSLTTVFANAGINGMQCPIEEMTLDEWRATIDTNLTGTFLTVKHAIPHLRAAGGGSVIITASVNGTKLFSLPGYACYSTSKGGQAIFGRMAAGELARWDIRVNTICPGAIRTNIGERTYRRNLDKVTWDLKMPEKWPPHLGRPADASEVADLVAFLASDESKYITGAEIVIDAGLTILRG
ncbi:MAG: SDR family oxidoreductase [Chloroflexi bacterium]|jgi:NAD(P)-dependent dehydrogenase (short-subunit alcohol dehydrogenase family)|nr:SDR family oxidoreductase [Chloroflexota bacterium]